MINSQNIINKFINECGSFEKSMFNCIVNNPKNDNFKFKFPEYRKEKDKIMTLKLIEDDIKNISLVFEQIIGKNKINIDYENYIVAVSKI